MYGDEDEYYGNFHVENAGAAVQLVVSMCGFEQRSEGNFLLILKKRPHNFVLKTGQKYHNRTAFCKMRDKNPPVAVKFR
jgi:hypothetical protein